MFSVAFLRHRGSVLLSPTVEMRDQNYKGGPYSFGSWDILVCRGRTPIHPQPLESCGLLQDLNTWNMPDQNPRS